MYAILQKTMTECPDLRKSTTNLTTILKTSTIYGPYEEDAKETSCML
jgi:hypothetical protein